MRQKKEGRGLNSSLASHARDYPWVRTKSLMPRLACGSGARSCGMDHALAGVRRSSETDGRNGQRPSFREARSTYEDDEGTIKNGVKISVCSVMFSTYDRERATLRIFPRKLVWIRFMRGVISITGGWIVHLGALLPLMSTRKSNARFYLQIGNPVSWGALARRGLKRKEAQSESR